MSKKTRYSIQTVLVRPLSDSEHTLLTVHRNRFKFLPLTVWTIIYLSAFSILLRLPPFPGKPLPIIGSLLVLVCFNLLFCGARYGRSMDEDFFQRFEFVAHLKLDPRLSQRSFSEICAEDPKWKEDAARIAEAKQALDEMTKDRPELKKEFNDRFEAFSKKTSEILDFLDRRDDIRRASTVVNILKG